MHGEVQASSGCDQKITGSSLETISGCGMYTNAKLQICNY